MSLPAEKTLRNTVRQVACHPVNNSRGKRSSIPPYKTRPDSPVPTLQGPCDQSQKWKDAKERAIRRRENKVLADGNCQSFHFLMAGMICAGKSRGVYAAV